MGRIPRDIVDAVRDRTDIVNVIGRHVTLQKRGASLVGLCPFHQEKSPSFNVIPAKAMYHCFGCQAGGDVFRFLMTIEGLSFVEAVKELAGPAGVIIEERELSQDERKALKTRSTLFDVLEAATSFFESTLWTHPDGQVARTYLRDREIGDELARKSRLGFAPEGWSRLLDHLHQKGFDPKLALDAGLASTRKGGDGHYDFFRGRLMFPIRDERGRVIGFGGRIIIPDPEKRFGGKYMNTPETRLYDKKRVLYGLDQARAAIQRKDQVVVVEGYFDVLAMQAAGHDEAVASCGTALTKEHLERIRRMTRNVVMLTDGDSAGQKAAMSALPLLVSEDMHAFRVELPGAKDPDEFVRAHGPEALSTALERRQSLVEWVITQKVMAYADKTSLGAMSSSQARERILTELLPLLGKLPPGQIPRVAGLLRIPEGEILRAVGRRDELPHGPPPKRTEGWKPNKDVVHILWLLVHRYDHIADLLQRVPAAVFADHPPVHAAMARLLTGEHPANVLEDEPDEGVRRTLAAVVGRQDLYEPKVAARGLCDMVDNLARPRLMARKTWLQHRLSQVQQSGDFSELRVVLVENQALTTSLEELDRSRDAQAYGQFVDALTRCFDALGSAPLMTPPPRLPEPRVAVDPDDDPPPLDAGPIDLDEVPDLPPFSPEHDGWSDEDEDGEPPFP